MSARSDKAAAAAEAEVERVLAPLTSDDYEEALDDLIAALRDRLNAARASRKGRK